MLKLFDVIKLIFSNKPKDWSGVSRIDKSRNFFMINRLMSIQYPILANQFNKTKIVPAPVVDWWHDSLSSRFSRTPQWVYTKTNKSNEIKLDDYKLSEETENFIREKYSMSKKDLETLKNFYPDKYVCWVKDVSEQVGISK